MRHLALLTATTTWPLAAICIALMTQGCARQQPAEQAVEHTARKVTPETVPGGTTSQSVRETFERSLTTNLERLDEEIRELQSKVATLGEKAKAEWTEKMAALDAKRKAAEAKLDEIRNSTGEAWEHLRDGAKNAWDDLEQAVKQAAEEF